MSKRKNKRPTARDEPMTKRSAQSLLGLIDSTDVFCVGYTSLDHNPEIVSAVNKIAQLVGSMTVYLMENTDVGDVRVVNGLSRKLDIEPNRYQTRSNFISWIVKTRYLGGNGNAVVYPYTRNGLLEDLIPIQPNRVSYIQNTDGFGYYLTIAGKRYEPDEVLHFALNTSENNPCIGQGFRVVLSDVAKSLKQAQVTKEGFQKSEWKPSLIIKVDGLTDEFSNPKGRRKLLDDYVATSQAGEPWILPSDQFQVEQIRPLTLSDLAISDSIKLDKQTVASILGIPLFLLGLGQYSRAEWENFIGTTVSYIAQVIQQEMTKKLIYSDRMYIKFNPRSLYNYNIADLADIGLKMKQNGTMTGNEVRSWLDLPPLDGLDALEQLENYIPVGMSGQQKKLIQEE